MRPSRVLTPVLRVARVPASTYNTHDGFGNNVISPQFCSNSLLIPLSALIFLSLTVQFFP